MAAAIPESEDEQRASFLPDMCGVRAIFGVVITGELLAIVLSLIVGGVGPGALERLSFLSLFIQWIGISAAAVLCTSRRLIARLPEAWGAVASYLLILLVVYVLSEVALGLINPLAPGTPFISLARPDFLIRTLGISAIVAALVLRYFFVQHHWRLRIVSEAAARLEALQARIRPHFLFNCMNTIASLTRSDPIAAEKAIEDLSDLFRASMARTRTMASFDEELALVHGYLNIEKLRLGERLQTRFSLDTVPPAAQIPLLTLQPLVENAIYHGIEPLKAGGIIEISIACTSDAIEIQVVNPVAEVADAHRQGNRLAQENIRQRLHAQFGEHGGLEVHRDDRHYRAIVRLPLGI